MALQGNVGETGKIRMPKINRRRSPRRALELAIRVFGTDFQGKDFVEDSTTLEVSPHGAKIRLTRQLIPEQEIRVLCQDNNREGLFRVVRQVGEPVGEFSFWGVECLNPSENIWEGALPRPGPKPVPKPGPQLDRAPGRPVDRTPSQSLDPGLGSKAKTPVQFMLRCSQCGMRELVDVDETQIQTMRKLKGLVRGCPACGATVLWKGVAVKGPRSV
ncbi:MAG: hypothetical protein DMG23_14770 [Acidobacteria bacterium]|nr:MAG: hypothetical protein DMG23_14770 [Acidobacteriota bacterium]